MHNQPFFSPKEIVALSIAGGGGGGGLFKTSFARSQPSLTEISYDVSQIAVFQVSSYLSPLPLNISLRFSIGFLFPLSIIDILLLLIELKLWCDFVNHFHSPL